MLTVSSGDGKTHFILTFSRGTGDDIWVNNRVEGLGCRKGTPENRLF